MLPRHGSVTDFIFYEIKEYILKLKDKNSRLRKEMNERSSCYYCALNPSLSCSLIRQFICPIKVFTIIAFVIDSESFNK